MESDSISVLNMIAQWASALGTISATIAALYFSKKNTNIKIKVFAEKAIEVGINTINDKEVISLTISNLNFRKCTITELYWKIPFHKAFYPERYNGEDSLINKLPITLSDGEQLIFNIPLNDFREQGLIFASKIKYFSSILVKFIRFGAFSSTKKEYESRIGKDFQKWVLSLR